MRKTLCLLLCSLVAMLVVGCGDSSEDVFVATGAGAAANSGSGNLVFNFVQAQTILPTAATDLQFNFLDAGNTVVFSEMRAFAAEIRFENVSESVVRAEVTSFNVDGLPVALSEGIVEVLVGEDQTVVLTTSPITLDSLLASPTPIALSVPNTSQVALQGLFSNGLLANLTAAQAVYSSNDPAIATVDGNGLVTAVSAGQTTITVTYTVAGTTISNSVDVPVSVAGPATNLVGANTFDTDTGFLNGGAFAGWDGTMLSVESFSLADGATLTVSGSVALQMESLGDITIDGLLDASGTDGESVQGEDVDAGLGGMGGPGGFAGGRGGGDNVMDDNGAAGDGPGAGGGGIARGTPTTNSGAGGGGAGHSVAGQMGSASHPQATGGAAGAAYESLPLILVGGSGGGGGSVEDDTPNNKDGGCGGGGGGGAVFLTAQGALVVGVNGVIDCSGGDGGSDTTINPGGGAGSGGSIRLVGSVLPTIDGMLNISGGIGGMGITQENPDASGGDGAVGRTSVETL
jgi:hypothetical protein